MRRWEPALGAWKEKSGLNSACTPAQSLPVTASVSFWRNAPRSWMATGVGAAAVGMAVGDATTLGEASAVGGEGVCVFGRLAVAGPPQPTSSAAHASASATSHREAPAPRVLRLSTTPPPSLLPPMLPPLPST